MTSNPGVPDLLVDPASVARRLGFGGDLSVEQRAAVVDRIVDAQDDAEAHLGRPLVARPVTLTGVYPAPGQDTLSWRAWPVSHLDDDVRVVDYRVGADGACDVDLLVGLDGRNQRALVRYVTAHAVESLRAVPAGGIGTKVVTSVSAGGQSVSYAAAASTPGAVGAPPTVDSITHLRRFSLSKPNLPPRAPWPLSSLPLGYEP